MRKWTTEMLRHLVAVVLLATLAVAGPIDTNTEAIVLTSTDIAPASTETSKLQEKPQAPIINAFNVISNISYRYATTVVSSRVKNPAEVPQTAAFSVVLPETAFISGFLMEIDGKVYKAHVKEKEEAKKEYNAAVQAGQAAAHVAVSARDSNRFTVDVSIPALQKATFNLTYEELLARKIGVYNHVLNLHPGQVVKDMTVDVFINENRPITTLRVPELRSGNEVSPDESDPNNSIATIGKNEEDKTKAHIRFAPTPDEQRSLMETFIEKEKKDNENSFSPFGHKPPASPDTGVKGQFVVQYDVERNTQGDEVMVYDGYFVHFFAPADLKPLPKHVVFVLDTSGSMHGRKIEQLRSAMRVILDDLKSDDFFHIINFSFAAKVWNLDSPDESPSYSSPNVHWWGPKEETTNNEVPPPAAYPANQDYIRKAKEEVEKLEANGGTNIYDSLEIAMKVANRGVSKKNIDASSGVPQPEPLIIFLTDGDPTVGETDLNKIYTMVDESKISDKPPTIFSLAFGDDADRSFLRKISLRNGGFLRHIYEAGDSSRQLQNFYSEVSSPLLAGVKFVYPKDQVEEDSLTRRAFPLLFGGSELVVAGRLAKPDAALEPKVEAISVLGPWSTTGVILPPTAPIPLDRKPAPLERLWAYLMIKQLLDQKDAEIKPTYNPDKIAEEDKPHAEPNSLQPGSTTKQDTPKEQALKLALKYSFVTPLTSLVVVKPNATDSSVDTETAKPGSNGAHALPLSFAAPSTGFGLSPNRANMISGGPYYSRNSFQARIAFSPKRKFAANSYQMSGGYSGFPGAASGVPIIAPGGIAFAESSVDRVDGLIDQHFESVDPTQIFSHSADLSTPFITSTSQMPALTGSPVPDALSHYPWLLPYLENDQLKLDINGTQHSFKLTADELSDKPDCRNALEGAGKCVPLALCPGAQDIVQDLQTYQQHFCTVEGFAAICCDAKNEKVVLP